MSDTSLDLFERVVRARGVAYSEWTPGEDRIQASPALAALFDLDPEDWTVQRLMDHIHPDDAKGYRAGLTSFMKSDADRAEIAVRYRRRNGGISWILNHNYAERDPSGRVTRLTTTSTEVTQEKEREAENRALLARQAASVEVLKAITASPDDPQPVFELIVRRACELCNAQAGNLVEYRWHVDASADPARLRSGGGGAAASGLPAAAWPGHVAWARRVDRPTHTSSGCAGRPGSNPAGTRSRRAGLSWRAAFARGSGDRRARSGPFRSRRLRPVRD